MARFLVEILIQAAGGPKARAAFDDVGAGAAASAQKIQQAGIQAERALRRQAEAVERLKDQMEETKASKGLLSDLTSLNAKLHEEVAAVREGVAGIDRLNAKRQQEAQAARIAAAQIKAGVAAHSESGRAIAEQIRLHDRLQAELHQTRSASTSLTVSIRTGISSLTSTFASIAGGIATVAAAYYTVSRVVGAVSREVIEAEKVEAQLRAGIASTGGVAGLTSQQLGDMAAQLSRLTTLDDEVIGGAQAILLTFTRIGRDVFPQATEAAANLSARMGTDLNTAALQVGKALNDPIKGMTALTRAGIQFTEAQKAQITQLVKSGDLYQAQVLILKELETQLGGSAKAARETLGGALETVKNRWGDLLEEIGRTFSGEMQSGLNTIIDLLEEWTDKIRYVKIGWLDLSADINSKSAEIKRDLADIIELTKYLLNPGAEGAADWLRNLADKFDKEAERQRRIAFNLLSTQTGGSGIFGGPITDPGPVVKGLGEVEDAQESARESARRLMADTEKAAASQIKLASAALVSADAHKKEKLAQDQAAKSDQIREAYLKSGLKWTQELTLYVYDLVAATKKAEEAEKSRLAYLKLLADASAKVKSIDLGRDLKALGDRAEKMMAGVNAERSLRESANLTIASIERETAAIIKGSVARSKLHQDLEIESQIRESLGTRTAANSDLWDALAGEIRIKITAQINAEIDSGLAESLRASLTTPRQALLDYYAAIDRLSQASADGTPALLSAADAEKLRTAATLDWIDTSLSAWNQFFSLLGQEFGGFFARISQLVQSLQSGYQTGAQIGSQFSSIGAGAGGAAGGIFALVIETYKWMKSEAEKRKSESYNYGASIVKGPGGWNINVTGQAREASLQIKDALESLADVLGGTIKSFASLEIQVRRDGKFFHAFVAGQFVGWFKDMQSAVDAAIRSALANPATTFEGVRDLLRQGLEYALSPGDVKFGSLDELNDFLGQLRQISDLHLGPGVAGALESIRSLDKLWETLGKIPAATQAVIDGFVDLGAAEARTWQALFDSITGRQRTAAEIRSDKEAELKIAKAELEIRKAAIAQRILLARAEIAALEAGNHLIGGGSGGQGGRRGGGGVLGVAYAFATAGQVMINTTLAVAEGVGTATQAMIDALKAEIAGLEALMGALGNLKIPDIGPINVGGGAGGGSDRQGVRDFIKDRQFQLSLTGLSDYVRSMRELDRIYDEQIKKAGNDKKLKEDLLALKEKEIQALQKEKALKTVSSFEDFLGLNNQFSQIRKTAADLIKDIQESPFGNERKARMIARVLAEVERKIEEMSQQSALSLFGEMAQDLEKYGADEKLRADVRRQMAILEHTLKIAHYRTEIEILRAQGKISAETLAILDRGLAFLEGVDPTKAGGGANDNIRNTFLSNEQAREARRKELEDKAKELANQLDRARDLLKKYTDQGLSPLERNLRQIGADFAEIIKSLGATPAVILERDLAMRRAITDAMGGLQSVYDSLLKGTASGLTPAARYSVAQSDYERVLGEIRAGNYTNLESLESIVQTLTELGATQYGTSVKGYQDLRSKLLAELGPVLSGTGLDISKILSGGGSSPTQVMTNSLIANNNTNTDRVISALWTIHKNTQAQGDIQLVKLSDIYDELALARMEQAQIRKLSYGT